MRKNDFSETFSVDARRPSESKNDFVNVETSKSRRTRNSSEVFTAQENRLFDEPKKIKVGQGKDFVHVVESNKENVSKLFCLLI